ncbi:MAG TPA: ATP-binding protein [Agitococcus sp.]|nr:ATP-binding protein [Agitococcus sp.]
MFKLSVNSERLVANLRYAFTDHVVLIAELMQNARRAGASKVIIDFDSTLHTLTVTDNGCGISDFKSLFTVAESGWDDSIKESENPFGMGFFSALFAADEVAVFSFDKFVCFRTKDVLAFENIVVETIEPSERPLNGSKVCLYGIYLKSYDVERAIAKYAKGFPIEVIFNNKVIDRPHAISDSFIDSSVGKLSLGKSSRIECYLQGLPVLNVMYGPRLFESLESNVIHLDATFKGKMPDRSSLYDESTSTCRVKDVVRDFWEAKLIELKSQLSGKLSVKNFAEQYWEIAESFDLLSLFNDVYYIPSCILQEMVDTPIINNWYYTHSFLTKRNSGLHLDELKSGSTVIFYGLPDSSDDPHLHWAAATMAKELKWAYIGSHLIPNGHWLFDYLVNLLTLDVKVNFKPIAESYMDGMGVSVGITLCENYSLKSKDHEVLISNQSVCLNDHTLLIPSRTTGDDDCLRQINCYVYNDEFDEHSYDHDIRLLSLLINAERTKLKGGNQVNTFNEVLCSGNVHTFSSLKDSIFIVQLDDKLQRKTTQIAPKHFDRLNQFLESLTSEN